MKEQFISWNSARYLQSEEDVRLYLEACAEEDPGDGSLLKNGLNVVARARGMGELARQTGLSREGLYKALGPEGNPSFATVLKVAAALGLRLSFRPVAGG